MKIQHLLFLFCVYITITTISACAQKKVRPTPESYDLNTPEKHTMPESLQEISGIAFNNYKNDTVYAIQDEEGRLFYFPLNSKRAQSIRFSKHGDYEDVAILNEKAFILKSDGTLYSLPLALKGLEKAESKEWQNLLPKGEYEGLYADNKKSQLYVLCKKCADDNPKKQVSGYILQYTNDSLSLLSQFTISTKQIQSLSEKKEIKFRPSALSFNEKSNEWYVLSASNKMLVITDAQWQVKNVFDLDPAIFLQPEGIAFDAESNLYISNEGDDLTNGNILKFKFLNK